MLHILTRASRCKHLLQIKESVIKHENVMWHVIIDSSKIDSISSSLLAALQHEKVKTYFYDDAASYVRLNTIIDTLSDLDNVYLLDEFSELHPDLISSFENRKPGNIYVFAQKDGNILRKPYLQFIRPGHIDGSQYIVPVEYAKSVGFENDFRADGIFIEKVCKMHPHQLCIEDTVLSIKHNLKTPSSPRYPRILFIGNSTPDLFSNNHNYWETNKLDVRYEKDDSNIRDILVEFKPDAILTNVLNEESLVNLYNAPLSVREKWINVKELDENAGQLAYYAAMANIMNVNKKTLVSFFTPIYNTGDKLYQTYESLKNQTYKNWEWVLMNDSTDEGYTLKIANEIATLDPRIKVYDMNPRSGGLIGEVKWRACSMTNGEILAELDHDDIVTPDCAEYLMKAAIQFPEAGFFYSDAPEVDLNWNSNQYSDGFALGYGSYRDDFVMGKSVKSSVSPGINPKTIRHIVGIPNHIRAWRRSTYFEVGGHARGLTIADDYELVVRTFLKTAMVHIPKTLYVQFMYNDGVEMNTQDLTRSDIQRRVKTIADYYNDRIADRFLELGKLDWAYSENRMNPLSVESRFGENECKINLTFDLNS
jgi:glycosyltransferase involved in cell wall biosynthesis